MWKKNNKGVHVNFDVVTIVFVVLKLCGVIDWSWWWVLSPMWGVVALILCFVVAARIINDR